MASTVRTAVPFSTRPLREAFRALREIFGATLLFAVWAALWLWIVAAALQPWTRPDAPPRTSVVQR